MGKRRDIIHSLTQAQLGNEEHVEQTLERGCDFGGISGQKGVMAVFRSRCKTNTDHFFPSVTFHLVRTQLFALPQLPGRYCATPVFRHHASPNRAIVQPYMLLGTFPDLCRIVQLSNIWPHI